METEAIASLAQSLSKAQKWTSRIDFDLSEVEAGDCCMMVNLMDMVKNNSIGKRFGFEYPSFFFASTIKISSKQ